VESVESRTEVKRGLEEWVTQNISPASRTASCIHNWLVST
jgi:hypothetical protein